MALKKKVACPVCGEYVEMKTEKMREHLAGHHSGAWEFDVSEVWECFGTKV